MIRMYVARRSVELDVVNSLLMGSICHLRNWDSNLSDGRQGYFSDRGVQLSWSRSLVVLLHGLGLVVHWLGSEHFRDSRSSVYLSDWCNNLSNRGKGLHNLVALNRFAADDGVESVVVIGGVVHNATVTISIDQRVLSLDNITVTFLLLALDITSVVIMNIVRKLIFGRSIGIFDMLDGLHQSRLDGLDKSRLDSLKQSGLLVNHLLWLVIVVFRLMMVLGLLVLLVVLGTDHSDKSAQSNVLKKVDNNETCLLVTAISNGLRAPLYSGLASAANGMYKKVGTMIHMTRISPGKRFGGQSFAERGEGFGRMFQFREHSVQFLSITLLEMQSAAVAQGKVSMLDQRDRKHSAHNRGSTDVAFSLEKLSLTECSAVDTRGDLLRGLGSQLKIGTIRLSADKAPVEWRIRSQDQGGDRLVN
uniref:Uncharacterized protein n=1 Tax=Anopheles culicifacies TaxID=139723 RepID=A0A182M872_9DIPT